MSISNKDIQVGDIVLINWNEFRRFSPYYLSQNQSQIFDDIEKNDREFVVTGLAMGHAYIKINIEFPPYVEIVEMEMLLPRTLLHKIY